MLFKTRLFVVTPTFKVSGFVVDVLIVTAPPSVVWPIVVAAVWPATVFTFRAPHTVCTSVLPSPSSVLPSPSNDTGELTAWNARFEPVALTAIAGSIPPPKPPTATPIPVEPRTSIPFVDAVVAPIDSPASAALIDMPMLLELTPIPVVRPASPVLLMNNLVLATGKMLTPIPKL